jgi:hypothetical protein
VNADAFFTTTASLPDRERALPLVALGQHVFLGHPTEDGLEEPRLMAEKSDCCAPKRRPS